MTTPAPSSAGNVPAPVTAPDSSSAGNTPDNPVSCLKHDEIVCILRDQKEPNGGYLVYTLTEDATPASGDNPFSLSVLHAAPSDLPGDSPLLAEFLLHPDTCPLLQPRPTSRDFGSPRPTLHVLVSTGSGLGLAGKFYDAVLRPLLAALGLADGAYETVLTRNGNSIRDFARSLPATDGAERTIVLLSGDGGVVDLLNGLITLTQIQTQTKSQAVPPPTPIVALLPLGTGNALFHSLHKPLYRDIGPTPVPSPLVLALRTLLLRGNPRPLPTFRARFSPGARLLLSGPDGGDGSSSSSVPVDHLVGAIVASYGFHASLVWESDTPARRAHGAKRFAMAAAELLETAHAYDAVVEVRRRPPPSPSGSGSGNGNGSDQEGEGKVSGALERLGRAGSRFGYVLATLVSNLERTFAISPAGRPLDGRLRLVHFGDVGGPRTMDIMAAAYRGGEHVRMPEVGYDEVDEVRVTIAEEDPRWRKVCVDGTIVEVERGGWMSVRREEAVRLRVLVHASLGA